MATKSGNVVPLPRAKRAAPRSSEEPFELKFFPIAYAVALHRSIERDCLRIAGGARGASIKKTLRDVEGHYMHLPADIRQHVLKHAEKCIRRRLNWLRSKLNIGGGEVRSMPSAG